MKTVAVCDADLEHTPLGTRSRLADELAGTPILRRTVERLTRCTRFAKVIVACPPNQLDAVSRLLDGLPVDPHARQMGDPPYRALVRTARKWSLDAWRGGLGGSSSLDEYIDVRLLALLAQEYQADAVAGVAPGAAFIDPALCDAMVQHAKQWSTDMRMTFAQAPPGLAPTIFQVSLCGDLAGNNMPAGWTLAYKPDEPQNDLIMKPACFPVAQAIRYASGRLTADTARSLRTMRAIIEDQADGDAESVARWLIDREERHVETLPREVEIELTTEQSLPDSRLRPREPDVPARGPLELAIVRRVAEALAADDDALVVLGGHGDPVLHPAFEPVLRVLREGGVYGLTVYTTGQQLSDSVIAALIAHRVDVVVFQLDAWTPETYAELTGGVALETAVAALDRLIKAREAAQLPCPIVVPQFTKCRLNVAEMDDFFDGWMRRQGCATVAGFSHYAHQLEDLSCTDMTPPRRTPCRRLRSRCVVLADGTVTPCDQDYAGTLAWGHLGSQTLSEVWTSPLATALRQGHASGDYPADTLCARCAEWHRP